jgi:uncharacterized protein (TIGR02145 family)
MRRITLLIGVFFLVISGNAQNVGIGTTTPDPSAKLEVQSTNSGFLPPRMTFAQRNAIVNPAAGLLIWCTDCDSSGQVQVFNGTRWCNMIGGNAAAPIVVADNLPSVAIGTQIWSTKNLDVARYRNGDPIPQVTDPTQWANLTTGAWCWYNNDSATYGATYGRLYNWYAVNDPRGLAPQGWHVPSNREWDIMTKFLDPTVDTTFLGFTGTDVGTKMKNTSGWEGGGNGSNSSGFSGLPGGDRYVDGAFYGVGIGGIWWSDDEFDTTLAWDRTLYGLNAIVYRYYFGKTNGVSVRVVRD